MCSRSKIGPREDFVGRLARSGVSVSKTGGAYRDPLSIISSQKAQKQLAAVARIKKMEATGFRKYPDTV